MQIETYHELTPFIGCEFTSSKGIVTLLAVTIEMEEDNSHFCRVQQDDTVFYLNSKELELNVNS